MSLTAISLPLLWYVPCSLCFLASFSTYISLSLSFSLSTYTSHIPHTHTPHSQAYIRARNADPKSSFGDFAALSSKVDLSTAKLIKREVSDGVIAPDFDDDALEMLKTKQNGRFIILKADPTYTPPEMEYREVFGVVFAQKRNDTQLTKEHFQNVVTEEKLSEDAIRDLLVASIALKYTQSNSVAYAVDGQAIGVGAGQQSRIDCVELAGEKADVFSLRSHPKVMGLNFKEDISRVRKTNARIAFISGSLSPDIEGVSCCCCFSLSLSFFPPFLFSLSLSLFSLHIHTYIYLSTVSPLLPLSFLSLSHTHHTLLTDTRVHHPRRTCRVPQG